jgi:hypothetical protein
VVLTTEDLSNKMLFNKLIHKIHPDMWQHKNANLGS